MRRSLFALLMVLASGSLACAADGTAIGVDPDAVARLGANDRILQVGADVSLGEKIVTGASGQVQILFTDQTRLVVGPQSTLLIESYLMTGTGADKFAINALAGSFRFISGKGPKSAYSIHTPTASIAVRGTKFDVLVENGQTEVMLYEGEVSLCSPTGACQDLTQNCEIGAFGPGGAQKIGHGDGGHGASSNRFRFARFPSLLIGDFRVDGANQCISPPVSSTPTPLGTSQDEKVIVPGGSGPKNDDDQPQPDGGDPTPPDSDNGSAGGTGNGGADPGGGSGGTGGTVPDDDDDDDQGENEDNDDQGNTGGGSSQGGSGGGSSGSSGSGSCQCAGYNGGTISINGVPVGLL